MVGENLPEKGIRKYTKMHGTRRVTVAFFYNEVIWSILEDFGPKGATVSEITRRSEIPEQTVRNILNQFVLMKRIKIEVLDTAVKTYKFTIINRWNDIR